MILLKIKKKLERVLFSHVDERNEYHYVKFNCGDDSDDNLFLILASTGINETKKVWTHSKFNPL